MSMLVFDIETIPDIASGRRLHGLDEDKVADEDVARALEQLQYQKSGHTFLPPYLHKIVVISVLFVSGRDITIKSLSGDEADIVKDFFNGLEHYTPQLVSWNGTRFDLPVLHYRALLHGISARRYWELGDGDRDFRFNNYLSRFHWRHIDLMDVLAAYDARATAPLDVIAKMIGLPGKQGMDGAAVWEHFAAGKIREICDYCEIDAVNTYLVYLRFELMRGNIGGKKYHTRCEELSLLLQQSDKQHLRDYADDWQYSPPQPG